MNEAFSERISLIIQGKEQLFSKSELQAIIEEYFDMKNRKSYINNGFPKNEWFYVKPKSIDRKLFEEERVDVRQEKTRELIVEAFKEMDAHSEKYARDFKTKVLSQEIGVRCSVHLMKDFIIPFGDHIADWVEQSLVWAQRISNGETWRSLCNDRDMSSHFRLVVWKNGYACIGGAVKNKFYEPATNVWALPSTHYDFRYLAPLVVKYF